jgi:hypothetical protein
MLLFENVFVLLASQLLIIRTFNMQHNCSSSILSMVDTRLPCIDIKSESAHIKMYLPLKFFTELLTALGFLPTTPSLSAWDPQASGLLPTPPPRGSPPSGRPAHDQPVNSAGRARSILFFGNAPAHHYLPFAE